MDGRALDFVALGILLTVVITLLYAIIGIHDIPYEISKKRNHPHQDAIHAAGWLSLFLLHAIWPFLWMWALLYKPERGWGMLADDSEVIADNQNKPIPDEPIPDESNQELLALRAKVGALQELVDLKAKLAALEQELEPAHEHKPESPVKES